MAKTFDPERHCGASTNQQQPCAHTKGFRTEHKGTGKCFLHGGCSTGPKTMAGKVKVSQNARKSGLYAKVLSGTEALRYETVQGYDAAEILHSNFYLIQSKVLGLLEGEGTFSKDAKTILAACELLVEQGEISSPDFTEELRLRLLSLDIERLSRILNSTVNLVNASIYLDRMGDMKTQLGLLKSFMVNTIRLTQERSVRELAVQTLAEMKLEAGLPSEELERLLAECAVEGEPTAEPLPEEDTVPPAAVYPGNLDDFEADDDPWDDPLDVLEVDPWDDTPTTLLETEDDED